MSGLPNLPPVKTNPAAPSWQGMAWHGVGAVDNWVDRSTLHVPANPEQSRQEDCRQQFAY